MEFTEAECAVLRKVQEDLPDDCEPFAILARDSGLTEEEVLELLRTLKEQGAIRRFGATLRHQKAGYGANAMVAWHVSEDQVDAKGRLAAGHPRVSHCYHRPAAPQWPYNLYTMVHGQNPEDCRLAIQELQGLLELDGCQILSSLKELKKTSMKYF